MTPLLVSLPPDSASAGLARRHLRDVCAQAGLEDLLDDALLLVTELVTNAVVHAGTALELRVEAGPDGLRVDVADGHAGGLPVVASSVEESREGGRGLFLLDALATSWGTTHRRSGKSLWFSLGVEDRRESTRPSAAAAPAAPLLLSDVGWLLAIGERTEELGAARVVRELLHRLADGLAPSFVALAQAGPDGAWELSEAVGTAPSGLSLEQVRRSAASGPTAAAGSSLVLALGEAGRPFGAVVLGTAAGLDEARQALARLAADKVSSLLQDERGRDAALRDRGALTLLAEASEMFAGALDVTLATTLLCQLVVPRFGTWAAVYGTTEAGAQLLAASHVDEERISELRVRLSSGPARRRAAELSARGLEQLSRLLAPEELPTGLVPPRTEVVAVPLVARRRVLGLLLLSRGQGVARPEDVNVLVDLSRRAALAVEGARLYEERSAVAQALQAFLLPPQLPDVDGLLLGARYAAAGEGNEVGGDFYDVFPAPDGEWAVAIGDVCGKGPEAATITGLARSVLRLMVEEGHPPEQAFRRLNTAILDLGERGRFLTAALALLRPHEGGVRVLLATAGHPPPVVVDTAGGVRFVGAGGTLLGVTPDVEIAVEEIDLAVGEQLVLYTDGVTERRDGAHWFGDTSLQAALASTAGRVPDVVAGHLVQRVGAFAPTAASDDLAVLVVAPAPLTGSAAPQAEQRVPVST